MKNSFIVFVLGIMLAFPFVAFAAKKGPVCIQNACMVPIRAQGIGFNIKIKSKAQVKVPFKKQGTAINIYKKVKGDGTNIGDAAPGYMYTIFCDSKNAPTTANKTSDTGCKEDN